MTPAELLAEAEGRLCARVVAGRSPWAAGKAMTAVRLDLAADVVWPGLCAQDCQFARVQQDANRPGRFVLAAADADKPVPALLFPLYWPDGEGDDAVDVMADVLALDLRVPGAGGVGRRFWRYTGAAPLITGARVMAGDVLRLRQDAHRWARDALYAAGRERQAQDAGHAAYSEVMVPVRRRLGAADPTRAMDTPADPVAKAALFEGMRRAMAARERAKAAALMHPVAPPQGALILDPAAIDWTRKGALRGVEAIEIVDAPAGGPLGRALCRLNPRIGGSRGVPIYGTEQEQKGRAA